MPAPRVLPRAAGLLLGAALSCLPATSPVYGQSAPRTTITLAGTLTAVADAETPIPIQVGPQASLPPGSIARIRGLPPLAALSAGYSIAPGAWAVPVGALPSLKIMVPRSTAASDVVVTVVAADGTVLAEAKTRLLVAAQAPAAAPATVLGAGTPPRAEAPGPEVAPPAARPAMSQSERERAMRLMQKGDQQLAEGGIAQARLFYERAAEAGLAMAAMALAATYDPAELDRLGVQGLQPDPATAAKWYERARQLGATEAAQRLQRLGAK